MHFREPALGLPLKERLNAEDAQGTRKSRTFDEPSPFAARQLRRTGTPARRSLLAKAGLRVARQPIFSAAAAHPLR